MVIPLRDLCIISLSVCLLPPPNKPSPIRPPRVIVIRPLDKTGPKNTCVLYKCICICTCIYIHMCMCLPIHTARLREMFFLCGWECNLFCRLGRPCGHLHTSDPKITIPKNPTWFSFLWFAMTMTFKQLQVSVVTSRRDKPSDSAILQELVLFTGRPVEPHRRALDVAFP